MDRHSFKIKFQFRHMCAIVSLARGLDIVRIGSLIVIQVKNIRVNRNIFGNDYSYLNNQFTINKWILVLKIFEWI